MTEDLYIDAQMVDMPQSSPIAFAFKSNLLGDISKVVASHSYTIRLPKTPRNRAVVYNSGDPGYNSPFPRRYHTGSYWRNGVLLIDRARVTMLETTADDYQLAMTFGLLQGLPDWLREGPTLRQLQDNGEFVPWDSSTEPQNYPLGNYGYAYYSPGVTLDTAAKQKINIHPMVSVAWIINKIQAENGVTVSFPEDRKAFIDSLYIPLIDTNASPASWVVQGMTGTPAVRRLWSYSESGGAVWSNIVGISAVSRTDPNELYKPATNTANPVRYSSGGQNIVRVEISTSIPREYFKDGMSAGFQPPLLEVYRAVADSSDREQFDSVQTSASETSVIVKYARTIDMGGFDDLFFQINIPYGAQLTDTTPLTGSIGIYPQWEELTYPGFFPIIPNLPDIKQIDLIKAVATMCGLFALSPVGNNKSIDFVAVSALLDNKSNAYDWSDRRESESDEPNSVTYALSNLAQRNILQYKEDGSVGTTFPGVIVVNDKTASLEAVKQTLPFAGTIRNEIKMYSVDDKGEYRAEKAEPRIVRVVESSEGKADATFAGLDFPTLISTYYGDYQELVNEPTVIKEKFRLSETDLAQIDYTRPVYLRQFGRFFGIVSLQNSGERTTAELLALPLTD